MDNSEAALTLFALLDENKTDAKFERQQKLFNFVIRIIHENISFDGMTDEEVEQLAMDIPQAVADYNTNAKMHERITTLIKNAASCGHRHLI